MKVLYVVIVVILFFALLELALYLINPIVKKETKLKNVKKGYNPLDDDEIDYSSVKVRKLNNNISEIINK